MATSISADQLVSDLVTKHVSLIPLFEEMGINYCCRGKIPLSEACANQNLDTATVVAKLQAALDRANEVDTTDWSQAALAALCDHVEQAHHRYLMSELPRLDAIVTKVVHVHGANHPELADVQRAFVRAGRNLVVNMRKEEKELFPLIRALEAGRAQPTVVGQLQQVEKDHAEVGEALLEVRKLTNDFVPPEGACRTYRAMLAGLEDLEKNTHQHIHKENNILFPRSVALAQANA